MTRSMMESPHSSITKAKAQFTPGLSFETDVNTNEFSPTADFLLLVTKYRASSDDCCCVLGAESVSTLANVFFTDFTPSGSSAESVYTEICSCPPGGRG